MSRFSGKDMPRQKKPTEGRSENDSEKKAKNKGIKAAAVFFLISVLFLSPLFQARSSAASVPDDSGTGAVYLYCLSNSSLLYEKNRDKEFAAASSAKMMTAHLTIEKYGDLSETVTLSEELLAGCSGSEHGFSLGVSATIEDLLKTLILTNSDNAAKICANLVSGGADSFVELMNQRADELSMSSTHYTTPEGSYNDGSVTTASDTAKLAILLYGIPSFMNIASLPYTSISTADGLIYTRNNLIGRWYSTKYCDSDVNGMNASTNSSGTTLVATATKSDGYSYLCIIFEGQTINSEDKAYTVASALFDWAVGNFSYRELISSGKPITSVKVNNAANTDSVPVFPAQDVTLYLPNYISDDDIHYEYTIYEDELDAPFQKGREVGEIVVYCEGKTVATLPLVTGAGATLSGSARFVFSLTAFFSHPATIILLVLALLFIITRIISRSRNSKKKRT